MIVFIILHYLALEDTRECILSIKKYIGSDDYQVVVVDNNSPDDSYSKLESLYENDNKVKLIHNNSNLGFARGNNIGFKYAKDNLNPEYIVLCNNDICLTQDNFYKQVNDFYKETKFDVMGPMIVNKDGCKTSNPEDGHIFSIEEIAKLIKVYKNMYIKNKYYILNPITRTLKSLMHRKTNRSVITEVRKNVVLHGSFLVFSKKYINMFDGLDSRTYMYLEEDILYLHLIKNNMLSFYNPEIVIYHKEDSSTNKSLNSNRKKEMFIAINTIESLKVYEKILNEYMIK